MEVLRGGDPPFAVGTEVPAAGKALGHGWPPRPPRPPKGGGRGGARRPVVPTPGGAGVGTQAVLTATIRNPAGAAWPGTKAPGRLGRTTRTDVPARRPNRGAVCGEGVVWGRRRPASSADRGRPPLSGSCGRPPRAPRQPPKGGAAAPPRPHAGPLTGPAFRGLAGPRGRRLRFGCAAPGPLGPPRRAPGRWGVSRGGGSASRPTGARGSPSGGIFGPPPDGWGKGQGQGQRSRAQAARAGALGRLWGPGPVFLLRPQGRMPRGTVGPQGLGPLDTWVNIP